MLDSSTLLSVALALQLVASHNEIDQPRVEVVENYHQTSFDIKELMSPGSQVLVLQSVSSTGSLTERLGTALDRSGQVGHIHVLVDRLSPSWSQSFRGAASSSIERWIGLAELDEVYANRSVCRICSDPGRSRFVQIDERSFDSTILPRPTLVSPSIRAARHNRSLWELANSYQAIGPLSSPWEETADRRPDRMDIKFYVGQVFSDVSARDVDAALRARVLSSSRRIEKRKIQNTDLVVAWTPSPDDWRAPGANDADDWESGARANVLKTIETIFQGIGELPGIEGEVDIPEIVWVDRGTVRPDDGAIDKMNDAHHILVFDWTTVSGHRLRSLLTAVRSWTKATRVGPTLRGLVVHARPESRQGFEDLQSAFDQDLVALWLTFMPLTDRSPFGRERELLSQLQHTIKAGQMESFPDTTLKDVSDFAKSRLDFLSRTQASDWRVRLDAFKKNVVQGEVASPYCVFWGMPLRAGRLEAEEVDKVRWERPRSLFGSGLDPIALLAAAGNAIQTVRDQQGAGPDWQQFDLPGTIDSFDSAISVVAFIRWLGPEEFWWGDDPNMSRRVVAGLVHRADPEKERCVVVSELLLASAEGKLPPDCAHIPIEHARTMLQSNGSGELEPYERMALQTGLVLCQSDLPDAVADRQEIVAGITRWRSSLLAAGFDVDEAAQLLTKEPRNG
ncbi:MAG: hypothetical protein GY701_33750 [Sulfitobacter sp.]|nr:hypothetical protein [Sulfitobacter sp.]